MRFGSLALASALISGLALGPARADPTEPPAFKEFAEENQACFKCDRTNNPGLAEEWRSSVHAQEGVGCYDCHRAEQTAADAFRHHGETIAVIVSPKDCARSHQREVDQQKGSHHAKAAEILASIDNFLGEVVGGPPAVAVGCFQCHGST